MEREKRISCCSKWPLTQHTRRLLQHVSSWAAIRCQGKGRQSLLPSLRKEHIFVRSHKFGFLCNKEKFLISDAYESRIIREQDPHSCCSQTAGNVKDFTGTSVHHVPLSLRGSLISDKCCCREGICWIPYDDERKRIDKESERLLLEQFANKMHTIFHLTG